MAAAIPNFLLCRADTYSGSAAIGVLRLATLAPSKIIHHGDTEDTEFCFCGVFSVISVPPWLIFIPMGGPQTHVILRMTRGDFSNG